MRAACNREEPWFSYVPGKSNGVRTCIQGPPYSTFELWLLVWEDAGEDFAECARVFVTRRESGERRLHLGDGGSVGNPKGVPKRKSFGESLPNVPYAKLIVEIDQADQFGEDVGKPRLLAMASGSHLGDGIPLMRS